MTATVTTGRSRSRRRRHAGERRRRVHIGVILYAITCAALLGFLVALLLTGWRWSW